MGEFPVFFDFFYQAKTNRGRTISLKERADFKSLV